MVKFFAGLSESEDTRQTDCRWQKLIQTKTVLQIPPSLKPPDRNKEWKFSYQTQIKLFYRDIHDRAGANNFISRPLTRPEPELWSGQAVKSAAGYFISAKNASHHLFSILCPNISPLSENWL